MMRPYSRKLIRRKPQEAVRCTCGHTAQDHMIDLDFKSGCQLCDCAAFEVDGVAEDPEAG